MTSQQKVTRRTVAKGAAWSVPVVAVAAAAPSASASPATCDFGTTPPVVAPVNCVLAGVSIGNTNIPSFSVSGLSASCVNSATWTITYNGALQLALGNLNGTGLSVLGSTPTSANGVLTATSAVLPVLDNTLLAVQPTAGVVETITMTVADGAGHTVSSTMSFTAIAEVAGALVYASCQ